MPTLARPVNCFIVAGEWQVEGNGEDADGWSYATDWTQPFVGTEKQVPCPCNDNLQTKKISTPGEICLNFIQHGVLYTTIHRYIHSGTVSISKILVAIIFKVQSNI